MNRIFLTILPARVFILVVTELVLIVGAYVLAVFLISPQDAVFYLEYQSGGWAIAALTAILMGGMYFRGMYGDLRITSRLAVLQSLLAIIGSTFLAEALFKYLDLDFAMPQGILIVGGAIALPLLFGWKLFFSAAIRSKIGLRRILFLGRSPLVTLLMDYLDRHPELGYAPLGYLDRVKVLEDSPSGPRYLGSFDQLRRVIEEENPSWIVLGNPREIRREQMEDLIEIRFGGLQTMVVSAFYELLFGRVCATQVSPEDMILTHNFEPNPVHLTFQTMWTTALSIVTLPLTIPLFVLLALLTWVRHPGGRVLIAETRIGFQGETFTLRRLRADWEGNPTFTAKLINRFGLDRLPQIWNVIRGEMSFMGPAADLPDFAARLNEEIPFYQQRTAVKPGITGWAQINQRADGSGQDSLRRSEYDLYYVRNLSVLLDLFILIRCFRDAFALHDEPNISKA